MTQWWVHCLEMGEISLTGAMNTGNGGWVISSSAQGSGNLAVGWDDGAIRIPIQLVYDAYTGWAVKDAGTLSIAAAWGRSSKSWQ